MRVNQDKWLRWSLSRLVLSGLLLSLVPAVAAGAEQAAWTVMLYLDADCNLEKELLDNIEETAQVGSGNGVHFVALVDRHVAVSADHPLATQYTDEPLLNIPNWTGGKLLYIQAASLTELADYGEPNMGAPATLQKFVEDAAARYPAQRYALILSDHAGSWRSICTDDDIGDGSGGRDHLTGAEIGKALEDAAATVPSIDLFGFDCCLIGQVEMAYELRNRTRYVVASEATIPGNGWNYPSFAQSLVGQPAMDAAAFGQVIVDSYAARYSGSPMESMLTLSLVDTSKLDALVAGIDRLSNALLTLSGDTGSTAWTRIASARLESQAFDRSGGYDLFDLESLCERLLLAYPDTALSDEAFSLMSLVEAAVAKRHRGMSYPGAYGLAIDFPLAWDESEGYGGLAFGGACGWSAFLRAFGTRVAEEKSAPTLASFTVDKVDAAGRETRMDAQSIVEFGKGEKLRLGATAPYRYDIELDASAVFLGAFDPKTGASLMLGTMPLFDLNETLSLEFDGEWMAISDGTRVMLAPEVAHEKLHDADLYGYRGTMSVQIRRSGLSGATDWVDGTLLFRYRTETSGDEESLAAQFVACEIQTESPNGEDLPYEYELQEGDQIRPRYLRIGADGTVEEIAPTDAEETLVYDPQKGLQLVEAELDPDYYILGWYLEDDFGNASDKTAFLRYTGVDTPVELDAAVRFNFTVGGDGTNWSVRGSVQLGATGSQAQDVYIALQSPAGAIYFFTPAPGFPLAAAPTPMLTDWTPANLPAATLLDVPSAQIPTGTWTMYVAFQRAGEAFDPSAFTYSTMATFDVGQ